MRRGGPSNPDPEIVRLVLPAEFVLTVAEDDSAQPFHGLPASMLKDPDYVLRVRLDLNGKMALASEYHYGHRLFRDADILLTGIDQAVGVVSRELIDKVLGPAIHNALVDAETKGKLR